MKEMNTEEHSGVESSPDTHSVPISSPPRARIFTTGTDGNPDILKKRLFTSPLCIQKGKQFIIL